MSGKEDLKLDLAAAHAEAKKATKFVGDRLREMEGIMLELAAIDASGDDEDPPGEDPPGEDPPAADPDGYGAPSDAELDKIAFKQVSGWWPNDPRPSGDAGFFEVYNPAGQGDTDRGLASGMPDDFACTFHDGRTVGLSWWAFNGHASALEFIRVSFINTRGEHDVYWKPAGSPPGAEYGCVLRRTYHENTGSQVVQVARRQWEMSPALWSAKPGDLAAVNVMAVNHAAHPSEGGTGTRRSHAFKWFSQQAGVQSAQTLEQVQATATLRSVTLDDSMQSRSMGFAFVGDWLLSTIEGCEAVGGHLEQHAISIDRGKGPVLISDTFLGYPAGRGVKIRDLSRPVKIENCGGPLLVYGPDGQVLSSVEDGYEQNWSGV